MMADLDKVSAGDIVLLHGCAHNPTGVDPTMEQWHKIAALVKAKGVIPFFDCVRLRRILDLANGLSQNSTAIAGLPRIRLGRPRRGRGVRALL